MTDIEIQYKVDKARDALEKCFDFLCETKPNLIEADYWLTNALAELNEVRKPLADLAEAEEKNWVKERWQKDMR